MKSYAAIILAAGFSLRMGCFKPLLKLGDKTVTDYVISKFLQNHVDVYLVTGWHRDELLAGIQARDITIVDNPDYPQGMFSSIKAGLQHLKPGYTAFFLAPVDIPLVRSATIRQILEAASDHPNQIIYPSFQKRRGHPPLIPVDLIPDILSWQSEGGLQTFLKTHESAALEITVPDNNIHCDMDTDADYQAMQERFQHYEIPTPAERDVILSEIYRVDPPRVRHCAKVAEVAVTIGKNLNLAGQHLDLELVRAAAALHDIAKGQPQHDITGGKILYQLGFEKVGDIVSVHTDLSGGNTGLPLASKVVYLADKYVQGENIVSLATRFQPSGRNFPVTPEIAAKILRRHKVALQVQQEIESLLGYSLETLLLK